MSKFVTPKHTRLLDFSKDVILLWVVAADAKSALNRQKQHEEKGGGEGESESERASELVNKLL